MINIGEYSELEILRSTRVGLFLGEIDEEEGEDVLLPLKYTPQQYKIGDSIKVFVYLDHAERKVATTLSPKIQLHEFAFLKVAIINEVGAFLDWGMEKQLLLPFREQRQEMVEGRWYIVYLNLDEQTDRLFASNKVEKYLQNEALTVEESEEVDVLIYQKTDLGYSVIVNNKHKGLLFENEIFTSLNIGDKVKGFVKKIREDRKLSISLQAIGYTNANDANCELIYKALEANNGFLAISDKSDPEEIYALLGISKKGFKKSIGGLYKERKIVIEASGIRII